jgi:IS30 family transposase
MCKKESELNYEERVLIYKYATLGASYREIGRQLGRHHTTISRELKRGPNNTYEFRARIRKAQEMSQIRKSSRGAKSKFLDTELIEYVSSKLRLKWSPEIIAGRYSKDNPDYPITGQSIYNYIYQHEPELIKLLPRKGRKRRASAVRRARKAPIIANKVSISKRPLYIQKRRQPGHWELDTMLSRKSKATLVIATERKTRVVMISKIQANNSENFKQAVVDRLSILPDFLLRTLTFDNGACNSTIATL